MALTNEAKSKRCAEEVRQGGAWKGRPCSHPAKYHEDGKDWCGSHLPSRVKAANEAREAKWKAEREAKDRARDHEKKLTAAREAVIQAAKAWAEGEWRDMDTQADLGAAVDTLNALESDNGTD